MSTSTPFERAVDHAIARENADPQGLPASILGDMEADIRANPEKSPLLTALLNGEPVFTVYGIPKDRDDDMTDGIGLPRQTFLTEDEAEGYVERNSSPDNYERYEIRERQ